MDTKQRNELNNQTDNGANEKWRPNAKGRTGPDTPLDHTYPQAAYAQQSRQGIDQMHSADTGSGPGPWREETSHWSESGGAMQSQQSGGSGPQQSGADSHQCEMAQHSQAWGLLEQAVGRRDRAGGTLVAPAQDSGGLPVPLRRP